MQKRPTQKLEMRYEDYGQQKIRYVDASVPLEDTYAFLHYHDVCEIGHVVEGSGTFWIGGRTYAFQRGDMAIVLPGEFHISCSMRGTESYWEYFLVHLPGLFAQDISARQRLSSLHAQQGTVISGEQCERFSAIFSQLREEWVLQRKIHGLTPDTTLLGVLTEELLLRFLRLSEETANPDKKVHENAGWRIPFSRISENRTGIAILTAPALEYILSHYDTLITIEELAALCHMSTTNFRRIFRKELGEAPLAYVTKLRMQAAIALLRGGASVSETAYRVGYLSTSSFYRHFQSAFQMSPSTYCKQLADTGKKAVYQNKKTVREGDCLDMY